MKTKVKIIMGFINSGKTYFINSILQNKEFKNERIVIIQDEFGKCEIKDDFKQNNKIIVIKNYDFKEINQNYIKEILDKYNPNRIFIEINGIKNADFIINIFNNKNINRLCKIDDLITIIDSTKLSLHLKNIKNIISHHIFNSETIILNNLNQLNQTDFLNLKKEIRKINETATIFKHIPILNEKDFNSNYIKIKDNNKSFIFNLFILSIILIFFYFNSSGILDPNIYKKYLDIFKKFYTIFLSILLQGFPFILIGSFVSSIIQNCISKDIFMKIFPKNIFLSCIVAAFSGLLFPICDCGTIPIIRGLIKKKVPIGASITFMLSAPIVNPIAIVSTIYAFQDMTVVVIYRVLAGIIISILVGLIVQFFIKNDDTIFNSIYDNTECDCGFCTDKFLYNKNKFNKLKAIFIHAGDEFFNVGKFMIIGVFLSSIFQSLVSFNNVFITNNSVVSLLIMIGLAFLLSVCSTSDAFIAKSFLKQFSINSVMGFLVVGPMLDIKNTIMLFGYFKKTFVFKLIFIIFVVSFVFLITFKIL